MDYNEVKMICREQLREQLGEVQDERDCPVCSKRTTMLKVFVEDMEAGEFREGIKWRCLNCLGLFSEKLVKEDGNG